VLALHAAHAGVPITKLALYEPPPTGDTSHAAAEALAKLVAQDKRGDAVEYFQRDVVGIPAEIVVQMRHAPFRPALEAIAHTLVYDMRITSRTPEVHDLTTPTLIISGRDSMGRDTLHKAAQYLAQLMPNAEHKTLNGLNHELVADKLGPELRGFLGGA
jgi:pimeloyl-ACP methyl ester carboxylesterase